MYALCAILILGFLLRVVGLSSHPAGFTPDEASFGYDAYSILLTGKDQWGNALPLAFKSFGDYKLPVYTYLAVPSVFLFGLSEFAVRLPNALLGSLAIFSTYLFVKELFSKKVGLVAALLLAISPWHVPLSRGAFEANLTVLFLPLGIFLFLRGLKDHRLLVLSAMVFGVNMFTYHTARLVTPLVVVSLVAFNFQDIKKNVSKLTLAGIVMVLFFVLSGVSFLGGSGARASTSTIFTSSDLVFDDRVRAQIAGEPNIVAKLFNNKVSYVAEEFIDRYLQYFSLKFLITDGPAEGTYGMLPGMGVIYLFELAALFVFIFVAIRGKIKVPAFIYAWLFLSPIPAALSKGPGIAANRTAIMMPALQVLIALGAVYLWQYLAKRYDYRYLIAGVVFVVSASFAFFLEDYFYQQRAREAQTMIYGPREIMQFILPIENQYDKIIITKYISEPHIFVAFYGKVDPVFYQKNSVNWRFEDLRLNWVDQLPSYTLGKYEFKHIDWVHDLKEVSALIVAPTREVPKNARVIAQVNYPNGSPAYALVDTRVLELVNK